MAKEKKEKVVIRKCHHCGKPLEEGKDFCLHCGHTYTEEDPFAAEKRAKRKKRLIKLGIVAGIAVAVALVILLAVTLIVKEINKSDYLRIVEFIKEEGYFEEGTGVPEEEESAESSESESESVADAMASVQTSEESTDESESESEDSIESSSESTEEEEENRMTLPETLDRYVYYMTDEIYLCCAEDDETRFYIVEEMEVEGLYSKIIIEISEDSRDECLWEMFYSYRGGNVVDSRYDFDYQYHGSFDPAEFETVGDWRVDIVSNIKPPVEDDDADDEAESESESESESVADAMAEVESSESTEESSTDEEGTEGEEGDIEDEEPQISPEQARENAAVNTVTDTVRNMIFQLAKCIEENGIGATFDELGFTRFYNYMESLDPLNDILKK